VAVFVIEPLVGHEIANVFDADLLKPERRAKLRQRQPIRRVRTDYRRVVFEDGGELVVAGVDFDVTPELLLSPCYGERFASEREVVTDGNALALAGEACEGVGV
jgi:hypothetical protein